MAIWVSSKLMNPQWWLLCSPSSSSWSASTAAAEWKKQQKVRPCLAPANCTPPLQENLGTQQQSQFQLQPRHEEEEEEEEEDVGIMCEPCNGRGWLVCDFCGGQKTNVKAENNRIYRRCPSCRAIGYVLCSKCKVFKCVTFPDYSDGEL